MTAALSGSGLAQMGVTTVLTTDGVAPTSAAYGDPIVISYHVGILLGPGPLPTGQAQCNGSSSTGSGVTFSYTGAVDSSGNGFVTTSPTLGPDTYSVTCRYVWNYPFEDLGADGSATFTITSTGTCTSAKDVTWIEDDQSPTQMTWAFEIDALPSVPNQPDPNIQTGNGTLGDRGIYDCDNDPIDVGDNPPTYTYNGWTPSGLVGQNATATWSLSDSQYLQGMPCDYGNCSNTYAGIVSLYPGPPAVYTASCQ